MKTLDRLSDDEVLALGKFIIACVRTGRGLRWRTRFEECAARGHFSPPVQTGDERILKALCERHGLKIVCTLRSSDVIVAANQVSIAYGAGPLELPGPLARNTSGREGQSAA